MTIQKGSLIGEPFLVSLHYVASIRYGVADRISKLLEPRFRDARISIGVTQWKKVGANLLS